MLKSSVLPATTYKHPEKQTFKPSGATATKQNKKTAVNHVFRNGGLCLFGQPELTHLLSVKQKEPCNIQANIDDKRDVKSIG